MRNSPQELVDYVIHFLRCDAPALATARLVCRAWNLSASVHLFRSLDLLYSEEPYHHHHHHRSKPRHGGVARFTSLLALLQTSLVVPHCVREVTLGRTAQLRDHDKQDAYARLASAVLSRLARVSTVFFRDVDWASLSPALSSCFLSSLRRTPTLEDVEFCNCHFLTASSSSSLQQVLTAAKSIRTLRLSYLRFLDDPLHAAEKLVVPPQGTQEASDPCSWSPTSVPCKSPLYSLAVDANVAVLHGLFASPAGVATGFPKLRRLYLSNVNDGAAVNEFLQRLGHELNFLDLRLLFGKSSEASRSALVDLTHCPRLSHLRVSGLHCAPSHCPALQLRRLFAKVADQSHPLEVIHLMITVIQKPKPVVPSSAHNDPTKRGNESESESDSYDWRAPLDVGLAATFPSLTDVRIDVKVVGQRQRHDVDGPSPESILGSFPTLRSRGVDVQLACT